MKRGESYKDVVRKIIEEAKKGSSETLEKFFEHEFHPAHGPGYEHGTLGALRFFINSFESRLHELHAALQSGNEQRIYAVISIIEHFDLHIITDELKKIKEKGRLKE